MPALATLPYSHAIVVRVRFAPSPTGSLHLGNALTAIANRSFADEHGGTLVLRIDDTDPARVVEGGEEAILVDLAWLGLVWDEGPVRQSSRADLYAAAAARALEHGATRDPDGSVRLGGLTLARPDGSATYQLATVADDLDLGITHVIRGSDHRPNEEPQRRIARALGGELPVVIHHGLLLGADGRKLSKREGHASVADLRADGIPPAALRAYLEELGLPEHDVHLDPARIGRLAIDAIAAMTDDELAAAVGAPVAVVPALRGARTLVEARAYTRQVLAPENAAAPPEAHPTLERFAELRGRYPEAMAEDGARGLLRELKAVGGDLRALRLALTGAERGPELWTVLVVLSRDEALARVGARGQASA
jgi:glutamyl-tRNA synthetase